MKTRRILVALALLLLLVACSVALAARYVRANYEAPEEWGGMVGVAVWTDEKPDGQGQTYLVVGFKHGTIALYDSQGNLKRVMTRVQTR